MTPEQLAASQQAGLEILQQFARQQFAAMEQFSALGLSVTKTAVADTLALLGAGSAQEAVALNLAATPKRIEKMADDTQALLAIAQQQREAFDALASAQHAHATALIDEWSNQGAPAPVTGAMKTATDAAHAAYTGWAAFAEQTTALMQAGLATAAPTSTAA